jgi:internalin A
LKDILLSGEGYNGEGDDTTEHLYIGHNNLTDFPRFPNITHLDIGHNLITDISNLPPKLKWLCVADNPVKDWSPIEELENLETLWAHDTDYVPEKFSCLLTNLMLDRTPPFDYELLCGLPLETLELEGHELEDLFVLEGMELEFLNLEGNNVKDISPLVEMKSLSRLNIKGCPIEDLTPLSLLEATTSKFRI